MEKGTYQSSLCRLPESLTLKMAIRQMMVTVATCLRHTRPRVSVRSVFLNWVVSTGLQIVVQHIFKITFVSSAVLILNTWGLTVSTNRHSGIRIGSWEPDGPREVMFGSVDKVRLPSLPYKRLLPGTRQTDQSKTLDQFIRRSISYPAEIFWYEGKARPYLHSKRHLSSRDQDCRYTLLQPKSPWLTTLCLCLTILYN